MGKIPNDIEIQRFESQMLSIHVLGSELRVWLRYCQSLIYPKILLVVPGKMLMLRLILMITFSYLFLFYKDKVYSLHVLVFSQLCLKKVYRYCASNSIPGTLAKSNSAWRTSCLALSPVTSNSSAICSIH